MNPPEVNLQDPNINLPNPPTINIEHVENFYGFDDDLINPPLTRNLDLTFPSLKSKSKSKRRKIKRKLKKILSQATRVYEEMVQEEFLLDDTFYEQEM